jgi:uncharacterized protein YyaL (SSP411 family)
MEAYTNELINETSPYLLQHANNPVNWVPWSERVFEQAKKKDKIVLISVGYSACHWCHVMEHESFEDEEVAALMNKFFINVKVDREERPDVDQVYMTAVQLMTNRGGWPLNCFVLPNGQPIYGGTYFPKEQWMHILRSLEKTYRNDPDKVREYARELTTGVQSAELISAASEVNKFEESKLKELVQRWSKQFDRYEGGDSRAPKFPLPTNMEFLLDYCLKRNDQVVLDHVELTLDKMAMGGIYDQIGGGFARYSVDLLWKVPHFEKMLYDNGQLISVYARAYAVFGKSLYKRIVYQTIEWLEREMSHESGAFYSALDADSEGVEGKFYVWRMDELESILGEEFSVFSDLYDTTSRSHWEEGNHVLMRASSDQKVKQLNNWTSEQLEMRLNAINDRLMSERSDRIRPGMDDKCLTSWNAMTLKGLYIASAVFNDDAILAIAERNRRWLFEHQIKEDGSVIRNFKEGSRSIPGFLEDYAHTIDALVHGFEVTGNKDLLYTAKDVMNYTKEHFMDEKSGMFFFTKTDSELIARKMEINDNVIPSSNSVMARNALALSMLLRDQELKKVAEQMVANVYDGMEQYGSGYSNWAILLDQLVNGCFEFVCTGPNAEVNTKGLWSSKIPQAVIVHEKSDKTDVPIFDGHNMNESVIYICREGYCLAPVQEVQDAIDTVMK